MLRHVTRTMVQYRELVCRGSSRVLTSGSNYNKNASQPDHYYSTLPSAGDNKHVVVKQEGLGRLPVPPLQQTVDKYLKSIRPLVADPEYERNKSLAAKLLDANGDGPKLQKMLLDLAITKENWLSDWFIHYVYMKSRDPIVINSNPGLIFKPQKFSGVQEQCRFAAQCIAGVLDYKKILDNFALPVDLAGKQPQCMNQYYSLLNTCRVPGVESDNIVRLPHGPSSSKHVTVLRNNHFFELNVYGADGKPLSIDELNKGLEKIVDQSREKSTSPVGVLTTEDRTTWANAYDTLIQDKKNLASLRSIQNSVFVLCLDRQIDRSAEGWDVDSAIGYQMLCGGGSKYNSTNRWFDKTFQMIVGVDGSVGGAYEHTAAEAPALVAILDHAVELMSKGEYSEVSSGKVEDPKKLDFNVSKDVQEAIEKATGNIDTLVNGLELRARDFTGFSKTISKSLKFSPDAFIQMGIHLAYYRMHGKVTPGYESASMRGFRLGRTEAIRACSSALLDFCKAMDADVPADTKTELMKTAITEHSKYTRACMAGDGVDRHLFGLKLAALTNRLPVPEIITDPTFDAGVRFRISSSQVPSKYDITTCFGPMYPDGYGFCYNPKPDKLLYVLTAFKSDPETDALKLAETFEKTLLDMQKLGKLQSKL
ncbi:carnitine O-acetyltransferase-like isoform X2 [Tubulanus polymorphus]|uniref:carnitine O-acetyltransferase-like isoform X2 n=1 Tax=Tubulanus polymorphus TaxID=672921 RepID=UPI003DA49CB2